MNTAISERLIDSTVKPDLARAQQRRLHARHAGLDVAGDVLQHDDGVVDDEAGRDGQRHQREVVEAEAQQVHHAERAEQRHRHRDAGISVGAAVAQEHEHHQRPPGAIAITSVRSTSCSEARMVVGAVDRDGDVDVGRERGLQLRQQRLHPVDGVDDVGAGLAVDDDEHRRLAVGEAEVVDVLDRSMTSATSDSRTAAPLR